MGIRIVDRGAWLHVGELDPRLLDGLVVQWVLVVQVHIRLSGLRRLDGLARPVYLVQQRTLVRLAAVRVAALHFQGLLGAGCGAQLLLFLFTAFARVGVALEQLVLRRILVLL